MFGRRNKWITWVALGVAAYIFRDKLKPLFDKVKEAISPNK